MQMHAIQRGGRGVVAPSAPPGAEAASGGQDMLIRGGVLATTVAEHEPLEWNWRPLFLAVICAVSTMPQMFSNDMAWSIMPFVVVVIAILFGMTHAENLRVWNAAGPPPLRPRSSIHSSSSAEGTPCSCILSKKEKSVSFIVTHLVPDLLGRYAPWRLSAFRGMDRFMGLSTEAEHPQRIVPTVGAFEQRARRSESPGAPLLEGEAGGGDHHGRDHEYERKQHERDPRELVRTRNSTLPPEDEPRKDASVTVRRMSEGFVSFVLIVGCLLVSSATFVFVEETGYSVHSPDGAYDFARGVMDKGFCPDGISACIENYNSSVNASTDGYATLDYLVEHREYYMGILFVDTAWSYYIFVALMIGMTHLSTTLKGYWRVGLSLPEGADRVGGRFRDLCRCHDAHHLTCVKHEDPSLFVTSIFQLPARSKRVWWHQRALLASSNAIFFAYPILNVIFRPEKSGVNDGSHGLYWACLVVCGITLVLLSFTVFEFMRYVGLFLSRALERVRDLSMTLGEVATAPDPEQALRDWIVRRDTVVSGHLGVLFRFVSSSLALGCTAVVVIVAFILIRVFLMSGASVLSRSVAVLQQLVVGVVLSIIVLIQFNRAVSIYVEQQLHVSQLQRLAYFHDDERVRQVAGQAATLVDKHDTCATIYGVPIRPTLRSLFAGYIATSSVSLIYAFLKDNSVDSAAE